jgi:hypothetical protein
MRYIPPSLRPLPPSCFASAQPITSLQSTSNYKLCTDQSSVLCYNLRSRVLYFSVRIIWRIRTRQTQKIALPFWLYLTAIMIDISAIRVMGMRGLQGAIDSSWTEF